jgi:hypothetical protein
MNKKVIFWKRLINNVFFLELKRNLDKTTKNDFEETN